MNNQVNFDTANKSFSEIIGNSKKYQVPKYQRDYSWEEEHWDELWQDILSMYQQEEKNREQHYMGYLVLQKDGINTFRIIDGQQRLTTLSLLILSALQILKDSSDTNDQERVPLIEERYISTISVSSFAKNYKLELNRNNDEYYRHDLASLSNHPRKRNIKRTEHRMRQAKDFYQKEIQKLKITGEELAGFIENVIAHYLLFTVITVGDDVNAYKVFETLNARGVQLSTPDLLKNHLFSIIDPKGENTEDIRNQEEVWSMTLDSLGKEDFTKFLRCFWNSRHKMVTKNNLFKAIKTSHTTAQSAIGLLADLKQTSPIYAALQNHSDAQWHDISNSDNKRNIQNCLLALGIFNISQPHTILLSAYFAYSEADFAKICKWLLAFCMRYQVICSLPPNEVDKFYNDIAMRVYKKTPLREIKAQLKSKLPSDDEFRGKFASKTLSTEQSNKKAYYLLAALENHINSKNPIELQGKYTIEHILPKKAGVDDSYWQEQFGDQLEQYVPRLGNMALLTKKDNQDAATFAFPEKKNIYKQSNLKIVEKVVEFDHWNTAAVNTYQSFLANQAVKIWSID